MKKIFILIVVLVSVFGLCKKFAPQLFEKTSANQDYQRSLSKLPDNAPESLKQIEKLKDHDPNNPQIITNIFLKEMGYPENLIRAVVPSSEIRDGAIGSDIAVGSFNFKTGEMNIHPLLVKSASKEQLTSTIRHELDHFEKGAQLCKSMGLSDYQKMLTGGENKTFNADFWSSASNHASLNGFDPRLYRDALTSASQIWDKDITSDYYNFVRLTEDVRNPLEISAYSISDALDKFYGHKHETLSTSKIAQKFNEVDYKIYKLSQNRGGLENSRLAIFDYTYAYSIAQLDPNIANLYNSTYAKGDRQKFWQGFNSSDSPYKVTGKKEVKNILYVLDTMSKTIDSGLTSDQLLDAVEYKYLLLRSLMKAEKGTPAYYRHRELLSKNVKDLTSFVAQNRMDRESIYASALITQIHLVNSSENKDPNSLSMNSLYVPEDIREKITSLNIYRDILKKNNVQNSRAIQDEVIISLIKNHPF